MEKSSNNIQREESQDQSIEKPATETKLPDLPPGWTPITDAQADEIVKSMGENAVRNAGKAIN